MQKIDIPINLQCEYKLEPMGIDTQSPRLTWGITAEKRNQVQTAYQILISASLEKLSQNIGDTWDTGKLISGETVNIIYKGKTLLMRTKYYWKVRAWDNEDAATQYSETASFEMSLLNEKDWKGIWIKADDEMSAPHMCKAFNIKKTVVKARAYICGLGYQKFSINGMKVSDDILIPDRSEFKKKVFYYTYDVTELLTEGENVAGVVIGNGWDNQRDRLNVIEMWYGYPRLMINIYIEYTDGTMDVIASDTTWKYAQGPILYNNVYLGEVYDARMEITGWDKPGYDVSNWKNTVKADAPGGKLTASKSSARKIIKTIHPVKILKPRKDIYVFDMGQSFSGWVKLKANGPSGTVIHMRFAEEVYERGVINTFSTGLGSERQTDVFVLKGEGEEVFEPSFTWHGFRYVEVRGYPGIPTIESVEGCLIHTELAENGRFECSNDLFNNLQEMFKWTQVSSTQDGIIVDSFRERQAYIGDIHVVAESAMYNYMMANFYDKYIDDIMDGQDEKGYIPHTVPFHGGGGGPGWGAGYILLVWYMYKHYSDTKVMEDNYNGMKKWVEYLAECTDGNHIIISEGPNGATLEDIGVAKKIKPPYRDLLQMEILGDWGNVDEIEIPSTLVNTYFYYMNVILLAKMAKLLKKDSDNIELSALAVDIGNSFNSKFLNTEKMMYSVGSQGSDSFALEMGVVPEEFKKGVVNHLRENIMVDNKGHLDTGIFGIKTLLNMLVDNGLDDVANTVMNKEDIPSFGYMVKKGATALWEGWHEDYSIYDYATSHNQPMFGSYSGWFYEKLAGICSDVEAPGYKNIIVKPHVLESLDNVHSSLKTVRGEIVVKWERSVGIFRMDVTIPANCTADVYIPKCGLKDVSLKESGVMLLESGSKVYTIDGVINLAENDDCVKVNIGSGKYSFCLAGN
ncbi:MAG TPA: family 78 glycoside hydrolase catalytic domain [Ruminiclostridium sp.]